MYAGQQVRILGENYTLDDEEDSKIGQVHVHVHVYVQHSNEWADTIAMGVVIGVWSSMGTSGCGLLVLHGPWGMYGMFV